MSHSNAHRAGAGHGTTRSYMIGFILSIILTLIPFGLVMYPAFSSSVLLIAIIGLALLQILVQLGFFLHMNTKSEGGWNMMALIFTIMIVGIAMAGSLWVMYHMNHNMMPDLMPEYMHTKTAP